MTPSQIVVALAQLRSYIFGILVIFGEEKQFDSLWARSIEWVGHGKSEIDFDERELRNLVGNLMYSLWKGSKFKPMVQFFKPEPDKQQSDIQVFPAGGLVPPGFDVHRN